MRRPASGLIVAALLASASLAGSVSGAVPAIAGPAATSTASAGGIHTCAVTTSG